MSMTINRSLLRKTMIAVLVGSAVSVGSLSMADAETHQQQAARHVATHHVAHVVCKHQRRHARAPGGEGFLAAFGGGSTQGSDLDRVTDAIQKQEGYRVGTRAYCNNNPGNMKMSDRPRRFGATGRDDRGYAIFPSYASGRSAMQDLLRSKSGQSLSQINSGQQAYAEGDPGWTAGVSKLSGIDPNRPLEFLCL